jgi:hypothetical protein
MAAGACKNRRGDFWHAGLSEGQIRSAHNCRRALQSKAGAALAVKKRRYFCSQATLSDVLAAFDLPGSTPARSREPRGPLRPRFNSRLAPMPFQPASGPHILQGASPFSSRGPGARGHSSPPRDQRSSIRFISSTERIAWNPPTAVRSELDTLTTLNTIFIPT